MILVQIVTVFIFYERHWDSVTRQMADSLSGEIELVVERAGAQFTAADLPDLQAEANRYFRFQLAFTEAKILSAEALKSTPQNYSELSLTNTLHSRIDFPFAIDLDSTEDEIGIDIQLANGVLHILAGRKTDYQLNRLDLSGLDDWHLNYPIFYRPVIYARTGAPYSPAGLCGAAIGAGPANRCLATVRGQGSPSGWSCLSGDAPPYQPADI